MDSRKPVRRGPALAHTRDKLRGSGQRRTTEAIVFEHSMRSYAWQTFLQAISLSISPSYFQLNESPRAGDLETTGGLNFI